MAKKLPLPDLRTIKSMALDAYCCDQTMKKALRGQKVQPTILAKIRTFINQHPVDVYRLDFAIVERKIAIEVDGHQFHQRTKAQAQHDKTRDRRLLALGWRTLRFTGSEVFHNADGCAREIARFLESAT